MKDKIFALTLIILLTQAAAFPENKDNLTILSETAFNQTTKQIFDDKPVIIHTQVQHYGQPTLKDYQKCHENLEKCKTVCEGVENPVRCAQECPICPFLIKEQMVVQGINDTDSSSLATEPINTTNIIHLTNEIRNVIQTQQGNLTNLNNNIVHVHQNTSRVGGKFGLGFNNTEPCCIVVSTIKMCEINQFSTANRCHRKRKRVCGFKCKERVMLAKRVTVCEKPTSYLSDEDYGEENCHETLKYVPYRARRKEKLRSRKSCSFTSSWPYVLCDQSFTNYERLICKRCLYLPYSYILQRGVPAQCSRCFMPYLTPGPENFSPFRNSAITNDIMHNDFLFGDNTDSNIGDWSQVKTKCQLPDGTISENCDFDGTDINKAFYSSGSFENLPEQDQYLEHDNYGKKDILHFENIPRKRRQTFIRSKYSRRYR